MGNYLECVAQQIRQISGSQIHCAMAKFQSAMQGSKLVSKIIWQQNQTTIKLKCMPKVYDFTQMHSCQCRMNESPPGEWRSWSGCRSVNPVLIRALNVDFSYFRCITAALFANVTYALHPTIHYYCHHPSGVNARMNTLRYKIGYDRRMSYRCTICVNSQMHLWFHCEVQLRIFSVVLSFPKSQCICTVDSPNKPEYGRNVDKMLFAVACELMRPQFKSKTNQMSP